MATSPSATTQRADLRERDQPPAVERVGQRAADQREQQDRHELGHAEQPDGERRVRQRVALERAARRTVICAPSDRDELPDDQQAELAPPPQQPDVERDRAQGAPHPPLSTDLGHLGASIVVSCSAQVEPVRADFPVRALLDHGRSRMPALPLPAALTGIRAKVLVAPALILALTAVLGVASLNALGGAADRSAASERAAAAIETLRDSNSRQFESDRLQYLALRATTPKDGARRRGRVARRAQGEPSTATARSPRAAPARRAPARCARRRSSARSLRTAAACSRGAAPCPPARRSPPR